MTLFLIKMAVKRGGKTHPAGTELEFSDGEIPALRRMGVIDGAEDAPSPVPQENAGLLYLAERIQELLPQGESFDGLNMQKTKSLLGADFKSTTRAEFDAAMATIKTDAPIEDEVVATVLETLEILAVDLFDEATGNVDTDKLKAELDADNMASDAAIAEAITQFKSKYKLGST